MLRREYNTRRERQHETQQVLKIEFPVYRPTDLGPQGAMVLLREPAA